MLAARLKNILFSLLAVEVICSSIVFILCCYVIYRNAAVAGTSALHPLFLLIALFFFVQLGFLVLFHQKISRFSKFSHSISWTGFFTAQTMMVLMGLVFLILDVWLVHRQMAGIIISFTLGSMILIAIVHSGVTAFFNYAYNRPVNKLRILLVGMNHRTREFCHVLSSTPHLGAEVLGYLDAKEHGEICTKYLGVSENINEVLHSSVIDVVFIFLPVRSYYDSIREVIQTSSFYGVTAHIVGNVFEVDHVRKQPLCINDFGSLAFSSTTDDFVGLTVKRLLDIVMSMGGLIALSPLLIGVAIFIKLTSKGPVFFYQDRVGLNKRIFRMMKFRTMVPDAEKRLAELAHLNEMDGPAFKITNDPRIIKGGSFLRRHSIDELPQLFNVFLGDMSVVGPRPLSKRDFDLLEEDWQRKRFSMRPGLTCIWQVSGRNNVTFMEWMAMDLEYIERWSLALDFGLIVRTVKTVIVGSGK